MATPPENDDANHSNAPLNFRHSNTLITTKVPHYPTKLTTGMSIIPGWNRPNANGQNANINDKDYNGPDFKARPLKHWRRQLQVYNYNGPANNSRTATISDLDRPGTTVYHFTPDCTCVSEEGGNSYIISSNKFGYEVKDNKYSKEELDVKVQNNGFTVVPYDATTAQINDPTNLSAYKIMTGIYNTNCINCSPQGNLIRSGIAFQSQAFFSYSKDKLETRCQTYEQNISTNKEPGCVYFDAQGIPLWPNDTRNGPQVVAPVNYQPPRLFNKPCLSQTIYKPNNVAFAKQGAVSGSTRIKKLVSDTTTLNGSSFYSARGAEEANLGRFQGTNLSSNYYVKIKPVVDSCLGTTPTPPVLSVVDRDTYSITFRWQELGNSLCNIVYYTITYYAINIVRTLRNIDHSQYYFNSSEGVIDIQDFLDNNYNEIELHNNNNNNTEDMVMWDKNGIINSNTVYTDRDNNIEYNIISEIRTRDIAPNTTNPPNIQNISEIASLTSDTFYLMSMTSTNGNGTSIRSNSIVSSTLLDSNIVISIEPITVEQNSDNYVYPYNSYEPTVLTVRLSSTHSTTPIILSITNASNPNVASITPVEGSPNTYEVRLENAGIFNLKGEQARGLGEFNKFGNSVRMSLLLTVTKATPIFITPWNISRNNVLLIGKTYPFFPLRFISPLIQIYGEYKIINIDGTESNIATFINNEGIESNTANFTDNFGENGTKILIKSYGIYGRFRIKATSIETQNYRSISTTSANIYVSRNDPIIEFKFPDAESFNRKFTYRTGQTYDIDEINSVSIISPAGPQSDVRITYSTISLETDTISDVATIDARTVTILNAGSFRIRARTNQTAVYNIVEAISPPVTIDKATPRFSEPWYLFQDINTVLFVGRTYSFNPPVFEYPYPGSSFPSASISITSYTISSSAIARLIESTTATVRIDGEGPFTITARTAESRNYNQVEITSQEEVSTQNTARVAFPRDFITSIIYGEEYYLKEADFIYPRDTYNFEEGASLSGNRITVTIEQYNYFIIGRRVTADIVSVPESSPPQISSIDDTITDKKIDISNGVTRHVIYIRNDTGISASAPVTITNIIQYISNPRDFYITYSIVSATGSASDVASISGTTVTLIKAGTFKIRAQTNQINPAPAPTIMNSTRDSPLITVDKATPVLRLNKLFPYTLQVGNTYSFNRAIIDRPVNIQSYSEILPITYISLNPDIITIVNRQPTASETPSLRVNRVGSFRIRAQTMPSDRYNIGYVESSEEFSTNPNMPLIKFDPNQNFGPFTYRENPSFTINEVIFINPIERHDEIEVEYYIPETNTVSLENRTVIINNSGEFTLRVKTIPTANFTISNILYKNITIQRYTPQFEEGWVAFINTRNVNYVFVGQTFEINPPRLISPYPNEETFPYELSSIQYRIEPERRAEISIISETSTVVKVLEEGAFYIYATTTENSINYNIGVVPSRRIYGSITERPIIEFPNNNEVTEITYGDDYFLEEAVFVYPEPIISIQGTATLSITLTETRIILENLQQYNAIVIGAYLRVTTTSSNNVNFIVINRMIETGSFIVVVGLTTDETLFEGNYTIQNMTQEMRIPAGGSIAYSVVPSIEPIPPSYTPVAIISGTNVTINRTGSFTIQAVATVTNDPPVFRFSSYPIFSTINVKRATPTLVFEDSNLFPDQVLFTGRRYNFTPAVVTIPSSVTHEELEIEYRSEPQGVVTIFPRDILTNTIPIRVNRAVPFRIIAQTLEPLSGNFNRSVPIYSTTIYGAEINTPVLFFPGPGITDVNGQVPVTNLTYGFTNSNGDINIYNVEQPAEFRYPYINDIPSDLTINYRINVDSSTIARVEMKEIIVDSDILGTITINAPVITILRAGEFTLIAETNAGKFTLIGGTEPTVEFRRSQPIYRKFNVQRATATFEPWYLFPIDDRDNPLLAGQRRTFNPPVFITPNPIPSQMNPSNFTYESSASLIASVETSIVNGSRVLTAVINRIGQFQIVASIPETDNYRAIRVYSENEYPTSINRPVIRFSRQPPPITEITYGDTYTLSPAYFYYPRLSIVESSGLYITHYIRNSSYFRVLPGTSPDYIQTVQILSAGTFRIYAETNVIPDKFEKSYIYLNVTVNPATPTITFPGTIFPDHEVLIVGTSYDFLPATLTIPSGVTDPIPQIRYRTNDASIATITTLLTPEGERRRINILRPSNIAIQIIAYTEATRNFRAARAVYSRQRISYYNTPVITAPSVVDISNNTVTYGQQPSFREATILYPGLNSYFRNSISIQHTSSNTNVATLNGTTITLLRYGTFQIIAKTVATGVATGVFRSVSIYTLSTTVNRARPQLDPSWNPIPNVLFIGDVVTITPPVFTFPLPVPAEILPITYSYQSASRGIITISQPVPQVFVNFPSSEALVSPSSMRGLTNGGTGDFILPEIFTTLFSPNNVVNTIRATIPAGISLVPYLFENVGNYGQNPNVIGQNVAVNCAQYNGTTQVILPNEWLNNLGTWVYDDMTIQMANLPASVGQNPILHFIDLWLPANAEVTPIIQIFQGNNINPSADYRRNINGPIVTGPAQMTLYERGLCVVRIYASDLLQTGGMSYIQPFLNGFTQFRIRVSLIIAGNINELNVRRGWIVPYRHPFGNLPCMTVNMSRTDNIMTNSGIVSQQITTRFSNITIPNGLSYRLGFLPLGITDPNRATMHCQVVSGAQTSSLRYTCSLENSLLVTINSIGKFRIRATTTKSVRYDSIDFYSSPEYSTSRRRPVIEFPSTFVKSATFGQPYTLREATFIYPPGTPNPAANGVTITYSIIQQVPTNPINVNNVASINGTTITIRNVGTFRIIARTTTTGVLFDNAFDIDSPIVTVNPDTPRFQTTPWNAFPTNTANVPIGTQLTITPPVLAHPSLELQQQNGFSIVYIINFINSSITTSVLTITPMVAGNFTVTAETRSNTNYIVARTTSVHTISVFNPIPPRIVLQNQTLIFQEPSIQNSPTFIQANPRGPLEWFAVVDNRSRAEITNYSRAADNSTFRPPGQTFLVPFNNIVTTLMTDMSNLFFNSPIFNHIIGQWDTRRVTTMSGMFMGATNFNQDLNFWNTSQVTDMSSMFDGASSFNGIIDNWNTENVRSMNTMFNNTRSFNSWISHWNTSRVETMVGMFQIATAFNRPLAWNMSRVINTRAMFNNATSFNANIFNWDTSNIITMNSMFTSARNFNQDITRWNTSRVSDMSQMFDGATNFNQPIGGWNTLQVTNMSWMFRNAQQFNQNIGAWNTSRVTDMQHMFDGASRFNNGQQVVLGFNGFLNQNERNMWFRVVNDFGNSLAFVSIFPVVTVEVTNPSNALFNRETFNLVTPRQTMNWNVENVRNMNFMFNGAFNFVNVDIRRWIGEVVHRDFVATGFRRGTRMENAFTPFGIWLRVDRGL
jgi:surface protein